MTTGVQYRTDPRCEVPAPSQTGICNCHAKQAAKAGVTIPAQPGRLDQAALVLKPDKELEP